MPRRARGPRLHGINYALALSALTFLTVGLALLAYANGRAREPVTA